jgi:hypothetical protein
LCLYPEYWKTINKNIFKRLKYKFVSKISGCLLFEEILAACMTDAEIDYIGASESNVGSDTDNIGASESNVGADTDNIGASESNVGSDTDSIGASESNVGSDTDNIGASESNVGSDTDNIEAYEKNDQPDTDNIGACESSLTLSALSDFSHMSIPSDSKRTGPTSRERRGLATLRFLDTLQLAGGGREDTYFTSVR